MTTYQKYSEYNKGYQKKWRTNNPENQNVTSETLTLNIFLASHWIPTKRCYWNRAGCVTSVGNLKLD